MVYRLVVVRPGGSFRYPIDRGDNLVGSHPDCAIRLRHPSVSRRHAFLRIVDGAVEIEDLGSRNGTRVNGAEVHRARVAVGSSLLIGAVEGHLEEVPDADLEAAVLVGGEHPTPDLSNHDEVVSTTLASGLADAFTLHHLPDIAGRLAAGAPLDEMAQRVGHALLSALPAVSVSVTSHSGLAGEGLLFTAHRDDVAVRQDATVTTRHGDLTVEVGFPSDRIATAFEPLVSAAAGLVATAARTASSGRSARRRWGQPPPLPDPPTVSLEMQAIYGRAARVARGDISVLILGESGTGKEVLAHYLHTASSVADGPFLCLNCAALPRDLLESELFGIERGVATGIDPRPGKFELADGGTLFLDEIGDMAADTQARILRVLQSGEVYRLGGRQARRVRIRVLAATNRDLGQMVAEGAFRADLYHRIAGWVVALPPLRRRKPDIPNLAIHFLAREAERLGIEVRGISRGALDVLLAYDWPGNVRELQTEMARAALFLEDGELLDSVRLNRPILDRCRTDGGTTLSEVLACAEREAVLQALADSDGVSQAATRLGVSRATLYRSLKRLGISHDGSD